MIAYRLSLLTALVASLVLAGCSAEAERPVYPVRGTVLFEGRPLSGAVVTFHPKDGDERSLTARTDEAGQFELTTNEPGDGAPTGDYGVTIEFRELVQEGDEKVRAGRHLLPLRYLRAETSGLQCTVEPHANELPAWNLRPK